MGAVLVELGDHLVAEQLERGEDLLVVHGLDRQAEHELVHADVAPAGDLLAHLVGRAAEHVPVVDDAVEELVGRRRVLITSCSVNGVSGHVMASGDLGIVSWYMLTIVTM